MNEVEKLNLGRQIGELKLNIEKFNQAIKDVDKKKSSAHRNRTAGIIVLLIAIIGFFFFYQWFYLWIFLGLVGLLTLLTAIGAMSSAGAKMVELRANQENAQKQLIELEAQLLIA